MVSLVLKESNDTFVHAYYDLEDEQLIDLIHHGEKQALDYLLQKYKYFVKAKTRAYFLIGADREDIIQEGMIGLFRAVQDFKSYKASAFRSFAELCITRQIITAVKTATRQKHFALNSYVSLDKPVYDEESDRTLLDVVISSRADDPADMLVHQETYRNIQVQMSEALSHLEQHVLTLYLDGWSYAEIAGELAKPEKSIDNALQRIKRKLEKYLQLNEA